MVKTTALTRSTAQFTVRVSNECGFHDNREPMLFVLTYVIPENTSKKYQLHKENIYVDDKTGNKCSMII